MDTPGGVFDPLSDPKDGYTLTRAIIDTIHEPLVVLDADLKIIAASNSFYKKFDIGTENTIGKHFYDLNSGQWNIPTLRELLEKVIPEHIVVDGYEVQHTVPLREPRTLQINARQIQYHSGRKKNMLLSIFDITEQRALEAERERLLEQKNTLLKEMRHRIANSLQLIASILLLKAGAVSSKESRTHLEDAHDRILSIANIQQQLEPTGTDTEISVAQYLRALCASLGRSMIGGRKPIVIEVHAEPGTVSPDNAVSFGLITTELVINSLKYAFPDNQPGKITVTYEARKAGWLLSVSDNGVSQAGEKEGRFPGLGTSIIGALANQLHAVIRTESSPDGTRVSILRQSV